MEHLSTDRYIIVSRYGSCKISFILTRDCRIKHAYEGPGNNLLANLIAANNFNIREASELLAQAKHTTLVVYPVNWDKGPEYWGAEKPREITFEELDLQIIPVEISASFFF